MTTSTCTFRNNWTDSGDRGAAQHDHDRQWHPDHTHVWGDSPYDWEQKGHNHIAPGDGIVVSPRPATVQRCTSGCTIRQEEDREGQDCNAYPW